ncbi:MAG: DUF4905 domain-containing protein [Bacteroidota bacterium]|jgi:hypothetical protein
MKFFSLFSNRLSPVWKFSAENILWRIMFSGNDVIIGEDRNTDSKTVTFFCLDASTGVPLWRNKTFGEQWWIGLDAVVGDRLYLHGYKKPDMPEHKHIIAVDVKTGELLWKNSDCTFLAIQPPFVYGYKDLFERRVYYRIDDRTGAILEELAELPEDIEENLQYERTDFTFPESVTEADGDVWTTASAVEGFQSAECIVNGKYTLLNVYSKNTLPGEGLKNTLSIIDSTTNKKVYSDVLNGSTPYPVPDSFFMDGKRVYYIKERKTFVALNVP